MSRTRYTTQQYRAMFAKMNQYPGNDYKVKKRWVRANKITPRSLHVTLHHKGREVGSVNLSGDYRSGDGRMKGKLPKGDWMQVTSTRITHPHRGKRLGSRLYIEALREVKKQGFVGLWSEPSTRSPNSNRVWRSVRSKQHKYKDTYGMNQVDLLTSVAQHRKRRGKAKRHALKVTSG